MLDIMLFRSGLLADHPDNSALQSGLLADHPDNAAMQSGLLADHLIIQIKRSGHSAGFGETKMDADSANHITR